VTVKFPATVRIVGSRGSIVGFFNSTGHTRALRSVSAACYRYSIYAALTPDRCDISYYDPPYADISIIYVPVDRHYRPGPIEGL